MVSCVNKYSRIERKVCMSPMGIGIARERPAIPTVIVYFSLWKSCSMSLEMLCPQIMCDMTHVTLLSTDGLIFYCCSLLC